MVGKAVVHGRNSMCDCSRTVKQKNPRELDKQANKTRPSSPCIRRTCRVRSRSTRDTTGRTGGDRTKTWEQKNQKNNHM